MKPSNQQATDGLRALLLDSTHINWISPLSETLNRDIKEASIYRSFALPKARHIPSVPACFCGTGSFHVSGAARSAFPRIRFGEKMTQHSVQRFSSVRCKRAASSQGGSTGAVGRCPMTNPPTPRIELPAPHKMALALPSGWFCFLTPKIADYCGMHSFPVRQLYR